MISRGPCLPQLLRDSATTVKIVAPTASGLCEHASVTKQNNSNQNSFSAKPETSVTHPQYGSFHTTQLLILLIPSDFKPQHIFKQPPQSIIMQVLHSRQDVMWGLIFFFYFFKKVGATDSCHTVCLLRKHQANYMTIR